MLPASSARTLSSKVTTLVTRFTILLNVAEVMLRRILSSPIVHPQSFGSSSEKTSFFRRRPEETPVMTRKKPEAIRSKSVRTSQNQSQPVTGVQAAIFCFNFVSLTNKIICYGNNKQRNPRRILR
ncbi:hypothetical protein SAMN05421793_102100 [Epilithonimonas hominis]|uniref:Uncharacterized protein n=1 Tax=Epilithonimonas hominis TaxID=420404 RepID=A0A1H6HYQ4_9FLAO|nr:hypothetical protein SAMN05421793_102100 [Epilithonimonas hominis]